MNHSSPKPLTRIPNSVPLRHMAVTTVLYSIPMAGSAMALPQAMARPRKIRSWLVTYPRVASMFLFRQFGLGHGHRHFIGEQAGGSAVTVMQVHPPSGAPW